MTLNPLESNLKALAKCQPALAEELRRQPAARHIQLVPLQHDIPNVDAIIVLGLPAPDAWPKLMVSRTPVLILAHNHLPEIKSYLTLMDIRDSFNSGRISFAVGDDGVLQVLNDLFGTLYRRSVVMFGQPNLPGHAEALKEMQFFETLCAANRATLDQFAREWQNNLSKNLKDFLEGPFLQDEQDAWSGGEAVLVAAGPSVDDVEIPAEFGGAKVVACDTAMPILAARGIVPDMIVTLDSSVMNQTYLQNLPNAIYDQSVLCVTPLVDRKVYQPFRRVLFYSYGHPLLDHLRENGVPFEPLASGGSVALTAVDIARLLGVQSAFLLGYDFRYYPFRTHAKGTGTALRALAGMDRLRPVEQFIYEYQNELDAPAPENFGVESPALMDQKFKKWKDWLELYVKNNDLKIYRMSEHSAHVRGVDIGRPSPAQKDMPLRVRQRPLNTVVRRELKFLMKESEMAASGNRAGILRRISSLPRVGKCMGYVRAWLADKPPAEADDLVHEIVGRFHEGLRDVLARYAE